MSSSCTSAGSHVFAIVYTFLSSLFLITILSLVTALINGYHSHEKLNRAPKWLFYTGLLFVVLSVIVLIKCIIYGVSVCNYISIDADTFHIIFNVIFADLYVIQLYFLWIVLFIRLYYILYETPYALSRVAIRIYSIIFIFSPMLTILLAFESLYTIFIVLGLSGGIFITLSIIILYIFKLIQVYSGYCEYNGYSEYNSDHVLSIITKNTILIIIATLFSLLILFVLIMNFIFDVYSISYGYQQQFLDICLLLDCYITTICLIFQFTSLHSKYRYFCGCIDLVCRYYCKIFVNPAFNGEIEPISNQDNGDRASIELRPPVHAHNENHLNVPFKSSREAILSESERSPTDLAQYNRYNEKNVIVIQVEKNNESASYETGQKNDFQDLPSLPLDDDKDVIAMGSHRAYLTDYNNIHLTDYNVHREEKETELELELGSNANSSDILTVLHHCGFRREYICRALAVYKKHYGTPYDMSIIREIIYRLTIKDKLKELKAVKNLYQSKDAVGDLLLSLNFAPNYVSTALTMYEVMAEMFEINKHHENIYDLELVTEMIMRLRAKDRERGDLDDEEQGDVTMLNEAAREREKRIGIEQNKRENVNRNELVIRINNNASEISMDASIPSSKGEELMEQQRIQRLQGNIPYLNGSASGTTATATVTATGHLKSKSLLDIVADQKENSREFLDVIADDHHDHQRNVSNTNNTDSLIEITANTNDMEMDGENSDSEEESEEAEEEEVEEHNHHPHHHDYEQLQSQSNIHNNSKNSKPISTRSYHEAPLADRYFDTIIAFNNAELRAHHNMDSSGNNIIMDEQRVYEGYVARYGEKPREPKHLMYFAKEVGIVMSFSSAMNVINANRSNNNNNLMIVPQQNSMAKYKSKSIESTGNQSNSATPLPTDLAHHMIAIGGGVRVHPDAMSRSSDDIGSSEDIQKIESIIRKDLIHNVHVVMDGDGDGHGNMGDDMDDMSTDADDVGTQTELSETKSSSLIDIEDASADRDHDDDDYLLPNITQIRPGDPNTNLMPVVPDNIAQHTYEYDRNHNERMNNINNVENDENYTDGTQSQSADDDVDADIDANEVEYEEEYYEDDDEYEEEEEEEEDTDDDNDDDDDDASFESDID